MSFTARAHTQDLVECRAHRNDSVITMPVTEPAQTDIL